MSDDLQSIIKRYQNDVTFHRLVDTMVQMVESGSMNRSDFFDALRLSDNIVFNHQAQSMEELLKRK